MTRNWLTRLNVALLCLTALLIAAAIALEFSRPNSIEPKRVEVTPYALPKHLYTQPDESYNAIGEPFLHMTFTPPALQLPNLQNQLIYYGRNTRPDAIDKKPLMYFSFGVGRPPSDALEANKRYYIAYDRSQTPPRYVFSPLNAPTPLWIEVAPQGNSALVRVSMLNEKGEMVRKPVANAQFLLPEREFARAATASWTLDGQRVDGTLLARQRARWYGQDKFLERYGGEEYKFTNDKQRIDFGEGADSYSIFIDEHSCLVWENGRWRVEEPGKDTLGKTLMCVKKIEPRLLGFELWDVEGKAKMNINLLKSIETPIASSLPKSFKFLGAKTRSQFLFEVNKERMTLSVNDWLIYTDKGWHKIETPEEIDAYVERKLTGPLFVFEGVERRDDKNVIVGSLFNPTRTNFIPIELPVQQGGSATPQPVDTTQQQQAQPQPSAVTTQEERASTLQQQLQQQKQPQQRQQSSSATGSLLPAPTPTAATPQTTSPFPVPMMTPKPPSAENNKLLKRN